MFQHAVDRALSLTSCDRTIVIAASQHRLSLDSQLRGRALRKLILQPANRDTAAGIFLPLAYVRSRDPNAIVVIHPSDHFIYPEARFLVTLRRAVQAVEMMPQRLLLLGVQPDRLETEYGWIHRGICLDGSPRHRIHAVASFLEKPDTELADQALQGGALWNTLILIARVESLWQAGRECFPDIVSLFEQFAPVWDTRDELTTLESVYRKVPAYNFSSHLLQRAPEKVAVMELADVLWSDWGKPERIAETLRRIGRIPAFPLRCLDRPFIPHQIREDADQATASA